jgi:hypothetical protein
VYLKVSVVDAICAKAILGALLAVGRGGRDIETINRNNHLALEMRFELFMKI